MDTSPSAVEAPAQEVADKQIILAGKSYQEYLAAVDEYPQMRVEYLDGKIIMSPAPRPIHQIIVDNLLWLLNQTIRPQQLGRVLPAPLDVELWPETGLVQPDLVFIPAERMEALIGEKRIHGAPDLAVEILSPSTAHTDRHIKLPRYAQAGIGEVWLIEPDDQAVELYVLDGESYRLARVYLASDVVDAGRFATAEIPVAEIFAA